MRQIRVKAQPAPSVLKDLGIQYVIPKYDKSIQDTKTRHWPNLSELAVVNHTATDYTESWRGNHYTNQYGVVKHSPDFPGSRIIGASYPGQSGQALGGNYFTSDQPWATGQQGAWVTSPQAYKGSRRRAHPGTLTTASFTQDVDNMASMWWIDERCPILMPMALCIQP